MEEFSHYKLTDTGLENAQIIIRNANGKMQVRKTRFKKPENHNVKQVRDTFKAWYEHNFDQQKIVENTNTTHRIGFLDLETEETAWFSISEELYNTEEIRNLFLKALQ